MDFNSKEDDLNTYEDIYHNANEDYAEPTYYEHLGQNRYETAFDSHLTKSTPEVNVPLTGTPYYLNLNDKEEYLQMTSNDYSLKT